MSHGNSVLPENWVKNSADAEENVEWPDVYSAKGGLYPPPGN